jgi:hypothetical protein
VLIAQHPTAEIDNELQLLVVVVGGVLILGLVVLVSVWREGVNYRRGARRGRWPTTKVREAEEGGWQWTCWYCNEVSPVFPTREAAEVSARQHTDHVDRTVASDR